MIFPLLLAIPLWASLVIYVAAVTNQAALIGVFFVVGFGVDLLDWIPAPGTRT